jgi:chemotaxis receptor (MCP) glutamine deamidase CheD
VLERAEAAVYSGTDLEGLSPERLKRHFEPVRDGAPGSYRVKDQLRRGVTFRQLNFIDDRWPIRSRFDFVMCRNASIYFDAPTQVKLFNRLADQLVPDGWLFVGHAEVLHWMAERLEASPGGIYHLRGGAQGPAPSAPRPSAPGEQPPRASAPPPRASAPPFPSAPRPPPLRASASPLPSAPRPPPPRASAPPFPSAPRPPPRASAPFALPRGSAPRPSGPRPSSPPESAGLEAVTINVGETHTSAVPVEIKTLLGSCVAACMYDPVAHIGGMNHFLLPHTKSTHEIDRQRFGVHAMETLINGLMRAGADRRRLQCKIFGGGNVLGSVTRRPTVGEQNAAFAREFLLKEGIELVAAHVGGNSGMEVRFHPHTGKVFVRAISRDLIDLAREEAEEMPVKGGDAELFT